MSYKKKLSCVVLPVLAAALFSPALTAAGAENIFHFVGPFSPYLAPLAALDGDSQVLYQPHDGSFEAGFTMSTQEDVEFVQFWRFPSTEGTLLAFEACFFSYVPVANFEFKFVYYSAALGGEEAEPGTFREDRDSGVFNIPAGTTTCSIITLVGQGGGADPGVEIRDLLIYLGAQWNAQDYPTVLLLVDANGPDSTSGWGRVTDIGSDWIPLWLTQTFDAYRNLGIRFVWLGPTLGDDLVFEDDFESGDASAWSDFIQ
jgi:hypothetical protein